MPMYHVYGHVTGGKYLGCFEAETEDEAIEKAIQKNGHVSLCHQCASECEDAKIEDATAELASDDKTAEEDEE